MTPTKLTLAVMLFGIGLSLFGNLTASFIWERTKNKKLRTIIGWGSALGFTIALVIFYRVYSTLN